MRIWLLLLTLLSATAHADTVSEQADQLLHKLEIQGSILTTRTLGTGSVLELHAMYSDTRVEELDIVIAYPLDDTDGAALDTAQVAAFALSRSVEASVPKVAGGGRADDGFVTFRFGGDPHLTPYLSKVFAAFGAAKVTDAHVESAKAQLLKIMSSGTLPESFATAQLLYTKPPAYTKVSFDERRERIQTLDLAAITKVIDGWKRGYVRVTIKGGKPAPEATAKLVRSALAGWQLGSYTAPQPRTRTNKTAVARHPTTGEPILYLRVELDAANEAEAAALQLLLQARGPLRERLRARKLDVLLSAHRSGMTIAAWLTIPSPRGKGDAALAAIRGELRTLAAKPLSVAALAKLQAEVFDEPGAFEDEKEDPRPIATQHAANTKTIKAIAELTPAQVQAAAKKLSTAPQAVVILEAKK